MTKPVASKLLPLFVVIVLLSACRITINSHIVKANKLEGCSKEYMYIPKELDKSGWYLTPPEYFTKSWKIYFGPFTNMVATECILKNDTCTITYYTKKRETIAIEIHTTTTSTFECFMKTVQAE